MSLPSRTPRSHRAHARRPRPATGFALALATTLALGACASATPGGSTDPSASASTEASEDLPQLTVGLTYTPDIQFSPFYLGVESGAFERAGVDVTLRHHGASEALFGAMSAGEEDVVFAGGAEVLQARSQSVDVVDFATLYQDYPVVLIVPEASPVESPEDLRGASVGVPGEYGETWFGLLAMLDSAGLTDTDVDVQMIGYTQQAALTTGAVDAVMGYSNNDAVQLEEAGVDVRTIPITDGDEVPLVGVGLSASAQTIDEDAAALTALVEGVREVMAGPAQDPDAVIEAAADHVPGLADATAADRARATWAATLPLYGDAAQVGAQDPERWGAMSTFMHEAGLLRVEVPADAAFTQEIVGE